MVTRARGTWLRGGRIWIAVARRLAVLLALVAALAGSAPALAAPPDELSVSASNAIVVDADNGRVLFDSGRDEQVAPASLTKIFTAIVALESAAVDTRMTVEAYDRVGEASIGLFEGEELNLETLLYGLMLTSGNDAAMTIARSLGYLPGDSPQESVNRFMERVNGTGRRLGLENTSLRNPHGLDQDGHYTTASDLAVMTMYALRNPYFQQIISTPYFYSPDDSREFYNVNQLLEDYSGLIGGKTGVTGRAGHCLVQVAHRDGKTVIVVLLGSTAEDWYADAQYLLDLGFDELERDPEGANRPVIGLTGRSFDVPEVEHVEGVGGNFTVNRLSDHEAVVRPANPIIDEESLSWRWPLVSVSMMALALVVALNFPALVGLGSLAFERGSRIQIRPASFRDITPSARLLFGALSLTSRGSRQRSLGAPAKRSAPGGVVTDQGFVGSQTPHSVTAGSATGQQLNVKSSPATSHIDRAIELSLQARFHAAAQEFLTAVKSDSDVDLTRSSGFWRMPPMGYIAAAKGYVLNEQLDDARRLLTIVQLAYKANPALNELFGRAIEELDRHT